MAYIQVGEEALHYLRMGTGSKVLLAFHGYGEEAGSFTVFEQHLGHEYTILAIDLPYHGQTEWKGKQYLTEKDLVLLTDNVKAEFGVEKVSLMGYSIGGRVCLAMLHAVPESIDKVLLMATDGLTINRYYYFVTHTAVGGSLFRGFLKGNDGLKIALSLKKAGLISDSYFRLSTQVLQFATGKRQLLHAWPCLSRLIHKPSALRKVINKHHIPVYIVMGQHDTVLPPVLAKRFAKGTDTVKVTILGKGHRIFDAGNAQQIAQQLL